MTNKLNRLTKIGILFLLTTLLLWNCQKDDGNSETLENSDELQEIISRQLDLKDLPNFSKVSKTINNLEKDLKSANSAFGKTTDNNKITVLTDGIIFMTYAETHTYTFKLLRENAEYFIENIVLHYNVDNDNYDEYLIQYDISASEFQEVIDGFPLNDNAEVNIYKLDNGTLSSLLSKSICFRACRTITARCTAGGNHLPDDTDCCAVKGTCSEDQGGFTYQSCGTVCIDPNVEKEEANEENDSNSVGGETSNEEVITNPNPISCKGDSLETDINGNCFDEDILTIESCLGTVSGLNSLTSFQLGSIADFINQNGCNQNNSQLLKEVVEISGNNSLSETEKLEKFDIVYDNFDPLLSQDAQISEYEARIRKSIQYFRWYGNDEAEEYADYLESLLPLDDGFSQEDYYSLYKTIRIQTKNLLKDYFWSIFDVVVESFKPVVQLALWEVGGGLALKMLSKLPVRYLTTPIRNVITRLRAPASVAFSKFKHAQKYGVKTYAELERTFVELGLTRTLEKVQFHHLIEQRFVNNPQIAAWIGNATNKWKSIVLTKTEHQVFTNAWRQRIPYINSGSTLNTSTATLNQVKEAAKNIYKDYPEILQALGL